MSDVVFPVWGWLWNEPVFLVLRWSINQTGAEMKIQTWKWTFTADDRVTTSVSHAGIKRLMKFATALLMCSCGSSSQMVCKATFNSWVSARVYGTFPAWRHRCHSPVCSNMESFGGHQCFSMNSEQFACCHSCMSRAVWAGAPSAVVTMVVTSSICSKSPFLSRCPHPSTKKIALCRATHIAEKTSSEMLKTSN